MRRVITSGVKRGKTGDRDNYLPMAKRGVAKGATDSR
jgi:hypothetical protein